MRHSTFPQTAVQAMEQLEQLDHEYLELLIERDCYGATPYLSGRTDQGWCILWSIEMIEEEMQ